MVCCSADNSLKKETMCLKLSDKCPQLDYDVIIDNNFTPSHQQLIYDALAEWSIRTHNTMNYNILVSNPASMNNSTSFNQNGEISIFSDFDQTIASEFPAGSWMGVTYWNGNNNSSLVRINPGISDALFTSVIRHELGHTFRMVHYNGNNPAIMHPAVSPNEDIYCEDLLDYCNLWGCYEDCDPTNISNPTNDNPNVVNTQSINTIQLNDNSCILTAN